jgi:spore maturation protein CgeB
MNVVILGLSITSSWGNGHATTYRCLMRELVRLGHDVLFLERDAPWYASNRDLPQPPYGRTEIYCSFDQLTAGFAGAVRDAGLVIVGSYVPEGTRVIEWAQDLARGYCAFYDIDTPVTLAKLERGDYEYLHPELISGFELYLSFTGGPTLRRIEDRFGAPCARVLYCSADPEAYYPENQPARWDMGYLGTYSEDRQRILDNLLLEPARRCANGRFIVAGPLYPPQLAWPANVERVEHLPPAGHREFYNAQRMTLNVTRADMRAAGYSPSVRLFEAAACGTPIVSDYWQGLETIFEPETEILIARCAEESIRYLADMPWEALEEVGRRGRDRVLREHTAAHRARQLEGYLREL